MWENKHWYSDLRGLKIKPLRFTQQARSCFTSWTTSSSWPTSRPTSRPRRNMWVNLLHKAQSQLLDPSLFCLFIKCRHVVVTLWFLFLFHVYSELQLSAQEKGKSTRYYLVFQSFPHKLLHATYSHNKANIFVRIWSMMHLSSTLTFLCLTFSHTFSVSNGLIVIMIIKWHKFCVKFT